MQVYLSWHHAPVEGHGDLDPDQDYIETDDKRCGIFSAHDKADVARQQVTVLATEAHPSAPTASCSPARCYTTWATPSPERPVRKKSARGSILTAHHR